MSASWRPIRSLRANGRTIWHPSSQVAALLGDNAGVYEELKAAILLRYNTNKESYRRHFTETIRESNRAYVIRLLDLKSKWQRDCDTVEKVKEAIGLEQFLKTLPTEKRVWVSDRKPETCVKAGEIADEFEQVRKGEPSTLEAQRKTRGK